MRADPLADAAHGGRRPSPARASSHAWADAVRRATVRRVDRAPARSGLLSPVGSCGDASDESRSGSHEGCGESRERRTVSCFASTGSVALASGPDAQRAGQVSSTARRSGLGQPHVTRQAEIYETTVGSTAPRASCLDPPTPHPCRPRLIAGRPIRPVRVCTLRQAKCVRLHPCASGAVRRKLAL